MLQTLHHGAQKWVGLLLFTLLIGSFVIWGIADVFSNRTPRQTIGSVGPVEITGQQLQNEVKSDLNYLAQLTGRRLSLKEANDFGLVDRTVNKLVNRALLEQEANRLGLRVSDDIILKTVRDIPQLKKPDGSFDAAAFRAALSNAGMSEKTFIDSQRITLARETLTRAVSGGTIVPPQLAQALAAAQAETRTLETYRVDYADQPLPAKPNDEVLTTFIKDHEAQFMRPEYRQLSFVRLSVETIAPDLAVSDDEVQQAYDSRQSELNVPETRTIKQVVFGPDEQDKAQALAAAAKGKDLASAAKAQGASPADLTGVKKDDLPSELQDAAFSLPAGSISDPVQSPLGWHVLQVVRINAPRTPALADVKDKIISELRLQKAGDLLIKESQQLEDQVASGASLDETAKDLNLVVQQVAAVDATGKDDKGNAIGPVLGHPEMLATAFKLAEGTQSNLVAAGDDYYVVKVDRIQPAALKSLAEVRTAALIAYNRSEQEKTATVQADVLVKALKAGTSFENAAQQSKVEATLEKSMTRDSALPAYLPDEFRTTMFGLKTGDVSQVQAKDAIVVARLQKIEHPVTIEQAKVSEDSKAQLRDALAADVQAAYTEQLKQRYPVRINRDHIATLFAAESEGEE